MQTSRSQSSVHTTRVHGPLSTGRITARTVRGHGRQK